MKLLKLKLNNFRQFYGEQTLSLSRDPTRNVTLVHAENGVGKTTLLNAILWCFYDFVTRKFERQDQILNFEAAAEGKLSAGVEVNFEHEGTEYMAQRVIRPGQRSEQTFNAFRINNGNYETIPAAETFINSVIPKKMAPYFFFDGEHAETFSSETNFKEVGQAIRNMLGCNLAETAIDDLGYVVKEFNKLIGTMPDNEQVQLIEKELSGVTERQARLTTRRAELVNERDALDEQIEAIQAALRVAEGAQQIQKEVDQKTSDLKETAAGIDSCEQAIVKWIGVNALSLVSNKLAKETLDFIDEKSLKGRIPSPYNEDFVRGLLSAGSCICDRELTPASPQWKAVTKLLENASTAEVLNRIVKARSRILVLGERRPTAPKTLDTEQKRLANLVERRRRLEQEVGELKIKMEGLPMGDIAERAKALRQQEQRLRTVNQEIGSLDFQLHQAEQERKATQDQLDKAASKSDKARILIQRRDLASRASSILGVVLQEHEADARAVIAKLINDILEKTARRDYRFQFRDSFSMELTFPDGRSVPRSSGENQLMSLAFIAALVQFSVYRAAQKDEDLLIPGTIAPLVLDSPFGQLDSRYREDTAAFVPRMASQVVLLVSSSQGDQSVLKALEPFVGSEYVLVSENRSERGEKRTDELVFNNKTIATSVFNCSRNLTRIERI